MPDRKITWRDKLRYRFENTLSAYDNSNYNSQTICSSFTSWYYDWTAGGAVTVTRAVRDGAG